MTMKVSPCSGSIPLVLRDKFHVENLTGFPWRERQVTVGKTNFVCVDISKTVRGSTMLLFMSNRKVHNALSIGTEIDDLG